MLKNTFAVGDVYEEETSNDLKVTVNVMAPDVVSPPLQWSLQGRLKAREEVLAVTAAGQVDGFRRYFPLHQATSVQPPSPTKTEASSLQGKTVAVRRRNGRPVLTVAGGAIAAEDRTTLLKSLDAYRVDFFPTRKIKVGESWRMPSKSLAILFGKSDWASASAKLLEIVTFQNQRCARVRVLVDIATRAGAPKLKMSTRLTGDLYHSLETNRPLAMSAEGPAKMRYQEKGRRGTVVVEGSGTLSVHTTYNWIKLGGKPVNTDPIIIQ